MNTTKPKKKRRRIRREWLPDQHGAWAMLIAPFVVGCIRGTRDAGFAWSGLLVFGVWFIGYFSFNALTLFFKSRKARFRTPMLTYGAIALIFAVAILVVEPILAWWVPFFAPFLLVALWCAKRGDSRSILSGAMTIGAACLMTPVEYSACLFENGQHSFGDLIHAPGFTALVVVTLALYAYFFGTVLYVKTLIRERTNEKYTIASIAYHAACTVLAVIVAITGLGSWWLVLAFVAYTIRAAMLAGRKVRPAFIGVGEIVSTTILVVICSFTI